MQKIKELAEKANSHGRHQYFYRDNWNHARSRLILVGAPTQRVVYRRAKYETSNSIESHEPSPCASGAPILASSRMLPAVITIKLSAETSWALFPLVHGGGRDINLVVMVSQDSRPTWYNIIAARARAEGFRGFF
jgi:hypothetical protein